MNGLRNWVANKNTIKIVSYLHVLYHEKIKEGQPFRAILPCIELKLFHAYFLSVIIPVNVQVLRSHPLAIIQPEAVFVLQR